jgi:cysteinyl-tRNA synthetase
VMANYWMHNGFLQVEGRKMSKSEGNFVTINELLETEKFGGRKWPGEVLRLAMLMTHYRQPIDLSERKLNEANTLLKKWSDSAGGIYQEFKLRVGKLDPGFQVPKTILDDLNLHSVLSSLSRLGELGASGDAASAAEFVNCLSITGFENIDMLSQQFADWDPYIGLARVDDTEIKTAISARLALIHAKNWAEADRIRDELLAQGIQLKDGKDPVTGERVTTWEVRR